MEKQTRDQRINNAFYEDLEEGWYHSLDHPIALLRAENKVRIPWILKSIPLKQTVLDLGCGAGMLTNALAMEGHKVHGIDLSQKSIEIAQKYDTTQSVVYIQGSALALPYPNQMFDVVSAMDLLEHVEDPSSVLFEASRVLKKGGLFFFHTFNRNFLSYLVVIKGVEWFIPNTPKNMHVYSLFIKPKELKKMCSNHGLKIELLQGFCPKLLSLSLLKLVTKKKISENFPFRFSKNLFTGYSGYARKV